MLAEISPKAAGVMACGCACRRSALVYAPSARKTGLPSGTLRIARERVDAGVVLRGHGGVKLNIFKRLHVPLAVLSVDGGDVRVHAVRQGLAVIYFYGLEHLPAPRRTAQ